MIFHRTSISNANNKESFSNSHKMQNEQVMYSKLNISILIYLDINHLQNRQFSGYLRFVLTTYSKTCTYKNYCHELRSFYSQCLKNRRCCTPLKAIQRRSRMGQGAERVKGKWGKSLQYSFCGKKWVRQGKRANEFEIANLNTLVDSRAHSLSLPDPGVIRAGEQ